MSDTSQFKFCTSCGAKLNISDRFCTQCGTPCKDLAGAVNPAADGTASFIRGHQLLTGQGMKKDFVAAQQAFHDAAAQGHKEAPFWESICQHYIEVVQLRQQADAMHRQLHPEDVHGSQAAALAGVAPAAQAAPHDHDNNNHGDQRHDRHGGSGSNWGKYAAGAVVGAAAASLLHGAGGSPAQAASPDESADAAYDPGTQDDTADTDVPYEDTSADTGSDDSYSDTDDSYSDSDDSSSDDSYSSDDSGGSSDGGGFFDDLFGGGGDDNDGGGFFGGGGDDGGGFFGGGDDDW
jgi:hypothetical protein